MQGFLSLLYSCVTTENTCYQSFLHVNTKHGPHAFLKKMVRVMVFNATFNNNSVISWRPVLLVEESRVPVTDKLYHMILYRQCVHLAMSATFEVQELNIYISYYTLENVSKHSQKNLIIRGQISL